MFENYNNAREKFISNPNKLIELEKYFTEKISSLIKNNLQLIIDDYNEASFLYPFWANYSPVDRGRSPKGDQIPWIEVGEHAIGHKLIRLLSKEFEVREVGLPSGADNRVLIADKKIEEIVGFTSHAMLFLDIKSVGPRDDAEHTVLSPYQISGNGIWNEPNDTLKNSIMIAKGSRVEHNFYPAISPIYCLSSGIIAPTIHIFVKPVYKMLNLEDASARGQPLNRIGLVSFPNGLLLTELPNYLEQYPGLLFPGKDDKGKAQDKIRCRISFGLLSKIAKWRVENIITDYSL